MTAIVQTMTIAVDTRTGRAVDSGYDDGQCGAADVYCRGGVLRHMHMLTVVHGNRRGLLR
jgi:hypothetical protein